MSPGKSVKWRPVLRPELIGGSKWVITNLVKKNCGTKWTMTNFAQFIVRRNMPSNGADLLDRPDRVGPCEVVEKIVKVAP
jgi:hypothetical protein